MLIRGADSVAGKVLVIGGGPHGAETALWLAQEGHSVAIVERESDVLATGMNRANRDYVRAALRDLGVERHTETVFQRVVVEGVEVASNRGGASAVIEADAVVMAIGIRPIDGLYVAASRAGRRVFAIGDAKRPRKIYDAISEGWFLAANL